MDNKIATMVCFGLFIFVVVWIAGVVINLGG